MQTLGDCLLHRPGFSKPLATKATGDKNVLLGEARIWQRGKEVVVNLRKEKFLRIE